MSSYGSSNSSLPDFTVLTAVRHVISHPVVNKPFPWLIRHHPGEHSPPLISNKQGPVVLCNGQGGDCSWLSVVRSFKCCVHCKLGAENKLEIEM